jgi:hypothetical protein
MRRSREIPALGPGAPAPGLRIGLIALLVLLLVSGYRSASSQIMQTILTNGPASNRLNIVLFSEGYTSAQLPQFVADATNAVNALLNHPPYQEYRSYCNAFALKVASNQSGSDHPVSPTYRDTYFNSSYDQYYDLLVTIPPNDFDTNYSHGQGKIDLLLQTNMPLCHLPILLVNDTVYGGSDGFDKTAIASVGFSSFEILTHETGHVLANLGDEYSLAYPGFPDTEEPNTTRQTNATLIKWKSWIRTNTLIPTPPNGNNSSIVGLFEGAHYHSNGWYRPKLNCMMNTPGVPFCEVCSEALVLAIYQRVRPVDSFAPAATNFSVTSAQALSFSLSLLQPATHNLSVQWQTNGTTVPGATNPTFNLMPASLSNGTQSVTAVVTDNTALVRNDPTNALAQTVRWTLNVNIPTLQLDSPVWLPGGKFAFRISGNAPQGAVVQSSMDFSIWAPLATNFLSGGQSWYTNISAAGIQKKFFRAVTPP